MSRRQPPRTAHWLLERLEPPDDALSGDLAEEYRSGRSAWWYWRQVLIGIVVGFATAVRAHPILTARALVIGWVTLTVLRRTNGLIAHELDGLVFFNVSSDMRTLLIEIEAWEIYRMILAYLVSVGTGWVVARSHPQHRTTAVLAFAAFAAAQSLIVLFTPLPGGRIRLDAHLVVTSFAVVAGLLIGGLGLATDRRDLVGTRS